MHCLIASRRIKSLAEKLKISEPEVVQKINERKNSFGTAFSKVHEYVHVKATKFMETMIDDPKTEYIYDVFDSVKELTWRNTLSTS